MKIKRLLEQVEAFLSAAKRERRAHRAEMKKVLNKLKKKEKKLIDKVSEVKDEEERQVLERKLAVVRAQRRKGVDALRETRKRAKQ